MEARLVIGFALIAISFGVDSHLFDASRPFLESNPEATSDRRVTVDSDHSPADSNKLTVNEYTPLFDSGSNERESISHATNTGSTTSHGSKTQSKPSGETKRPIDTSRPGALESANLLQSSKPADSSGILMNPSQSNSIETDYSRTTFVPDTPHDTLEPNSNESGGPLMPLTPESDKPSDLSSSNQDSNKSLGTTQSPDGHSSESDISGTTVEPHEGSPSNSVTGNVTNASAKEPANSAAQVESTYLFTFFGTLFVIYRS